MAWQLRRGGPPQALPHLLHCSRPKHTFKYPKVTIKQTSKVLKDYFSVGEWLKRRKRKALVKKELHKLNPSLELMDGGDAFRKIIGSNLRLTTMSRERPCTFYWRLPGRITSLQ